MTKVKSYLGILLIVSVLIGCNTDKRQRVERENGYIEIVELNEENNTKVGPYELRDEFDNLIEEGNYKNAKLDGPRRIYHPDGETVMTVETYKAGKFEGTFQTFYRSGDLELEGQYVDNVMKGKWKGYYPTGQLKEIVTFESNKLQGPFIEYYNNGSLKAEGNYLNGDHEHGELLLYDSLGVLERKMDCDKGRCSTTWVKDEE